MPVAAARRISASAAGSKLAENLGGVRAVLSGLGWVAGGWSCQFGAGCGEGEWGGGGGGAVELERRRIDPGVAGLVQQTGQDLALAGADGLFLAVGAQALD